MTEKDLSVTLLPPATLLLLDDKYFELHQVMYEHDGALNADKVIVDLRKNHRSDCGLRPLSGQTLHVAYQHLNGLLQLRALGNEEQWLADLVADLLSLRLMTPIETADDVMVSLLPKNVLSTFAQKRPELHARWARRFREGLKETYLFTVTHRLMLPLQVYSELGDVQAEGEICKTLEPARATLWVLPEKLDKTQRIALTWWLINLPEEWEVTGTQKALSLLGDIDYPAPPVIIDDVFRNTA